MNRKNPINIVCSPEAHEALKEAYKAQEKYLEEKAEACLTTVKVMIGKGSLEKIGIGTFEALASFFMDLSDESITSLTELLRAIKETEDEDLPLLMNSENEHVRIYVAERMKSEKFNKED